MSRSVLLAYQLITGFSDACTGIVLISAPAFALEMMRLEVPPDTQLVYVSYIGSFVFAVGLCCLYGVRLILRRDSRRQLGTVWLLTGILRASVALFVLQQVIGGALASAWLAVAGFDGACVIIQAVGLRKGWANAAR